MLEYHRWNTTTLEYDKIRIRQSWIINTVVYWNTTMLEYSNA